MTRTLRLLHGLLILTGIVASCQGPIPVNRSRPAPPVSGEILDRLRPDTEGEGVAVIGSPVESPEGEASESPSTTAKALELEAVLAAVDEHFPLILAAVDDVDAAQARVLSASGAFDTRLTGKGLLDAEGFYESERVDVGFKQATRWLGAEVSGGYRYGSGDFAVYDGKAETNEGGELRVGVSVPLLQGRAIDKKRVAEWRELIELERADPLVVQKRIESMNKATESYWKWVSAGQRLGVARNQLSLAEDRKSQIQLGVDEGLWPPIATVDNERSIVSRRNKLFEADRKLQNAAIQLSLFLRDTDGNPLVPSPESLPQGFPSPRSPNTILVAEDHSEALRRRPELLAMDLELSSLELDLKLARNSELPSLDLGVYASQDVGDNVKTPDDKGPFELGIGLNLDVPLQRRTPRGKTNELKAKIRKQQRKLQYARDIVVAEVQDATLTLNQNWLRVEQARENVRLTEQLAEAERLRVREGQSDLFRLNQREQQAASAADELVLLLEEHFRACARYTAVLGIPYAEVLGLPPR